MPWTSSDAVHKTKKAKSPLKKRKWARIANGVLASGKSEASAIRIANSAVKR